MGFATPARVLVVDDEATVRHLFSTLLARSGHEVVDASSGSEALELIAKTEFDAIISDLAMPRMDGIELMRAIRERDLDVPVIIVTASPSLESAMDAIELGVYRFLAKPVDFKTLVSVTHHATASCRTNRLRRRLFEESGHLETHVGDQLGLAVKFESAVRSAWMAYQPIVRWSSREVIAYEALVRSREPALPHPGALFDAAERLQRVAELGRHLRTLAPAPMTSLPAECGLFINLHPLDLNDPALYAPDSALSKLAGRVVVEITERASLNNVKDTRARVRALRELGYRIALDDIGAGYAGLSSFELLEPDVVKLDMSLIRDVHRSQTKQKLISSILALCTDPDRLVVAEGVETMEELEELLKLGCDVFQGYLFARPAAAFPGVEWPRPRLANDAA